MMGTTILELLYPSFIGGFEIRLQSIGSWGRKYNDVKNYILEVFTEILARKVEKN